MRHPTASEMRGRGEHLPSHPAPRQGPSILHGRSMATHSQGSMPGLGPCSLTPMSRPCSLCASTVNGTPSHPLADHPLQALGSLRLQAAGDLL